jgi:hypothetical protein
MPPGPLSSFFHRPVPGMSLHALDPAVAAANRFGARISPAGRAGLLAAAALSNSPASEVLRCAMAAAEARGVGGAVAVSSRETSQGRALRDPQGRPIMAITLGTLTKLDDGVFSGTLKTLNVSAALTIVPIDKDVGQRSRLPGLCRAAL